MQALQHCSTTQAYGDIASLISPRPEKCSIGHTEVARVMLWRPVLANNVISNLWFEGKFDRLHSSKHAEGEPASILHRSSSQVIFWTND